MAGNVDVCDAHSYARVSHVGRTAESDHVAHKLGASAQRGCSSRIGDLLGRKIQHTGKGGSGAAADGVIG